LTQAIDYQLTHRFTDVDISDREFEELLAIASWQQVPKFPRRGRVALHILEKPISVTSAPECKLKAAKLKGVGAWNPKTSAGRYRDPLLASPIEEPIPPTTQPLDSFVTYPHLGLTKDNDYTFVYGDLAPVGGILHERALLEYQNAKTLLEKGVPTIAPLAVIQYEDRYTFKGKPMGAVICLLPDTVKYRLSEVQFGAATQLGEDPDADEYYYRIRESLGVDGDPSSEVTRLQIINILSRQIGKLIHDFSLAGLYRYSPEWSNFEYDFERKQVVLTDLDSSRNMNELSPELRMMQALRDLGSLVYRTLSKFYTPSVLEQYTLTNLLKYDPLFELIVGYFPDAPQNQIKDITKKLWNCFIPYFFTVKKYQKQIETEWSSERRRSYKMDHDLFYILAMTILYPLFQSSDVYSLYPSNLELQDLRQKAKVYLGDRYEYFLYLESATFPT